MQKAMQPRRLEEAFKRNPIYYLTLVADDRRSLFANRRVHETIIGFGQRARERGVSVGHYVLMPDHIHLFAMFGDASPQLSKWIKSLKNSISKSLRESRVPAPHWQKGFFDHVLRSQESYSVKWEYVRQNPV